MSSAPDPQLPQRVPGRYLQAVGELPPPARSADTAPRRGDAAKFIATVRHLRKDSALPDGSATARSHRLSPGSPVNPNGIEVTDAGVEDRKRDGEPTELP